MIGDALRLIRTFHDMSQRETAEALKISTSYLSEIENGKKAPSLELIEEYGRFFKIAPSSVLFFSENVDRAKRSERIRASVSNKIMNMMHFVSPDKLSHEEK